MARKRKYSKSAQREVRSEMHALKGKRRSKRRPKNRKQAIAIGLSKARKKGAKVPARKKKRK